MIIKKKYFLNGYIIDPCNSISEIGGLIIDEKGKIEASGKRVNINNIPNKEKYTDLNGKHIFPGIVDMRVFGGEPGYEYKENYRSLSEAALAGGITSVVTMPNTNPVIDSVSIVDFIQRRGRDKSKINIFPTATLTKDAEGTNMCEFGLLKNKGIVGFTDGIKSIQSPRVMSRIIKSAYDFDCLVMQHAEDPDLSKDGMINDGIMSTKLGIPGISDLAEKILIERDLSLLEETNCRYHISQISSRKSLDLINYKKDIVNFTTGVSINNLALNENDIGEFRTFLKLSPPLRSEEDRLALIDGVKNDLIDVIVSDHIPEDEESKRLPFAQSATGSIGIETLLSLALELYHNDSLPLEKIIKCLTINPAKILKIDKGTLKKGADADLCIFDLEKPWVVKAESLKSKSKNTAIENRKLQGKVKLTLLKGEVVFSI